MNRLLYSLQNSGRASWFSKSRSAKTPQDECSCQIYVLVKQNAIYVHLGDYNMFPTNP